MPPLKMIRHEKIALSLFQGKTQEQAFIAAGYKVKWARSLASHTLATKRDILKRVIEMHNEATDAAVMTVKERKIRLSEIARGNITDYQSPGGIYIDKNSPNIGAIESLEIKTLYSRDSQAGNITIKRPVVPEALRNEIFLRDGNQCVLCKSTHNLQLDHIVSLSKGGRTEKNNLQTLCEACNKEKGAGQKSQAYTMTKLKLHSPISGIQELNKMEGAYAPAKIEVEPGENMAEALKELLSGLRGYEKTG